MRVVVGPVSGASARSWLAYARGVIAELEILAPLQCAAMPDTKDIFDAYVTEWEEVVGDGATFLWQGERAPEHVQYHLHALHRVADALAARAAVTGERTMPDTGVDFYGAVVRGMLDALEAEGPEYQCFVEHLSAFWPGRALPVS